MKPIYFLTRSKLVSKRTDLSKASVLNIGLTSFTLIGSSEVWQTDSYETALNVSKQLSASFREPISIIEKVDTIFSLITKATVTQKPKKQSWSGVEETSFNNRAVGKLIATYRKKKGWKQYVLADKLGVSGSRISQIETGAIPTTISVLAAIAKYLDVPLAELVSAGEVVGPRYFKEYFYHHVDVQSSDKNLPRVHYQISSPNEGQTIACELYNWSSPNSTTNLAVEITKEEYDKHLRFATMLFTESMVGKQRPMIKSDIVLDATNYEQKKK